MSSSVLCKRTLALRQGIHSLPDCRTQRKTVKLTLMDIAMSLPVAKIFSLGIMLNIQVDRQKSNDRNIQRDFGVGGATYFDGIGNSNFRGLR